MATADGFVMKRQAPPTPHRRKGGAVPVWPGLLEKVAAGGGAWFLVKQCGTAAKAGCGAANVRRTHDRDGRFEIIARDGGIYARLKTK